MTRFVGTPLRGIEFANLGDEALSVRILGDAHSRLRIDAGGRLTWSSGSATGDVNLYRDSANVLTTDDAFKASAGIITITTSGAPSVALADGAIAVDTTNNRFYFRSTGTWRAAQGGAIVSATTPSGSEGDLWFDTTDNSFSVYSGGTWNTISGSAVANLNDLTDVVITSPSAGQVLKFNGTNWINDTDLTGSGGGASVTVSATAPTSPSEGDLWWDTTTLEMFIYYSSSWVQVTQNDQLVTDLADLADVSDTVPTDGQVLQFNNATAEWEPTTLDLGANSLNELDDVTITSATNGDFLRWNGTDWINDAVNLSTDTIGDYVEGITAGTGITITGSGGEASTPTIEVTANTYDAFGAASTAESNANSYTDTQIGALSIPSNIDDLGDVTITTPTNGQVLKFNGTTWVNATDETSASIASLDDIGDVVLTSLTSGQVLKWNGTNWVNDTDIDTDTGSIITASDTAPTSPSDGDMWWDTTVLELFIWSSGAWIQVTDSTPPVSELADLVDVADTLPNDGQVLQYNSVTSEWEPATITTSVSSIDDIGDVTITSPTVGQVIKWNGTAWVNDTDDAGTTITSLDDIGDVSITSVSVGQVLKWNGTAWVNGTDDAGTTITSLDDIGDVAITSVASGDFLKWNGTNWVNDPINLGTDTTGNYISDVSAGTGVTVSHTPGEGSTPTVSIGQAVGTTDNVTFAGVTADAVRLGVTASNEIDTTSGNLTIDSAGGTTTVDDNLIITGDLTVNGTTTTVNTATLNVSDNIVVLNNDVTGSPTENAGIEVERGTSPNVLVRWNETTDKWEITNDGITYGNIVTTSDSGTITSGMIADGTIVNSDISASASIALSKLANGSAGQVVVANSSGTPTFTTISGDITIDSSGIASIASNAVALGTDTTGNYVVDVSAGTGVSVSHTPGEGSTPTVSLDASINDLSDVDTSVGLVEGDFLKWTGSKWANEPIDLGTDTVGNYVSDVTAGTGITVTHTPGEGSSATVELNASINDLSDVTVTTPSAGDFLKWTGTEWVNDAINLGTDTTGSYVESLVAGTNITITNNSGEGATPTISVSGTIGNFDSISTPDYIQFDTTVGSPAALEGKLQWDSDFGTLSFGAEGSDTVVEIGFNNLAYCYNQDTVTITKGTPVYISGGQGSQVGIQRAYNTSDAGSARTLGLAAENITAGGSGYVITYGVLKGIDTSAYTVGQILYLGSTPGSLTTTKPYAPNHYVFIGVVVKADVGGEIWLRPQNGYELDEIHDVDLTTTPPTSGDFLKYNGTLWVNDKIDLGTDTNGNYVVDVSGGTGVTVTHTPGEGSTPSVAIGQDVSPTSTVSFAGVTADSIQIGITGANEIDTTTGNLTIDSAGGTVTVDDNLIVSGDLTVNGTTTTLNTENLVVEDNIIVLNGNVTASPTLNAGIEIERGTSTNVSLRWNETSDTWQFTNDGVNYFDVGTLPSVSSTPPSTPPVGQLWFNQDTAKTYVYYDSSWVEVGAGASVAKLIASDTAPSSPSEGTMWFKSDTAQTFTYYDSSWIELGASGMAAVIAGSPPDSPISGQIWFNSTTGGTYVYFGSTWIEIGAAPLNVLLNTIDAKGDLLVGTADNTVDNLTVGTNGQILVANSSTATGLEWQTPSYASTGKAIAMSIVFSG